MNETLPNGRSSSRFMAFIIATGLAIFFNLAIIVVICWWVIPKIEKAGASAERSAQEAEKSRAIIESNTKELEEHRKTIKRLNELLDIAAARAKEIEAKKKGKNE